MLLPLLLEVLRRKLLPPQALLLVVQGHLLRLLLEVVQGLWAGDGEAGHEERRRLLLHRVEDGMGEGGRIHGGGGQGLRDEVAEGGRGRVRGGQVEDAEGLQRGRGCKRSSKVELVSEIKAEQGCVGREVY